MKTDDDKPPIPTRLFKYKEIVLYMLSWLWLKNNKKIG